MTPIFEARKSGGPRRCRPTSSTSSGSSRPSIAARSSSMRLVDDGVGADLDALALGDLARVADRAHVEADDDRLGRRRRA